MKTRLALVSSVMLLLGLPLGALAADHNHSRGGSGTMGGMTKGTMEHQTMDHAGMDMSGDLIMLGGAQTAAGVAAMAHLKDVKDAMAKMGMKETHHFMVAFNDVQTDTPLAQGSVAVKIVDPSGKESDPIMLMGMQGHFGADIALTGKGEYAFKVGSKLADGTKRQFEFKYTLK